MPFCVCYIAFNILAPLFHHWKYEAKILKSWFRKAYWRLLWIQHNSLNFQLQPLALLKRQATAVKFQFSAGLSKPEPGGQMWSMVNFHVADSKSLPPNLVHGCTLNFFQGVEVLFPLPLEGVLRDREVACTSSPWTFWPAQERKASLFKQ